MTPRLALFGFLLLCLTACTRPDPTPPTLAITTPASGSPVSGTTTVLVSAGDEASVARVELFARGRGGSGRGVPVASAVRSPFALSWNTLAQPNHAELELVAVGQGQGGGEGESAAVMVRTQNSGVPTLQLLTAFTLPLEPEVGALSLRGLPVDADKVLPPVEGYGVMDVEPVTQATEAREFVLEVPVQLAKLSI